MRNAPPFRSTALCLVLIAGSFARAENPPAANGVFVCEVREIPRDKMPASAGDPEESQRLGIQAGSGTNSRLTDFKVLTSTSGFRSVSKGPRAALEVESIVTPDQAISGGNFSYLEGGENAKLTDQGAPGKTYLVGSNAGSKPELAEVVLLQTALEITAPPAEFPNTDKKISLIIEIWELPMETAAALVKPPSNSIEIGRILTELRALAKAGAGAAMRMPLLTVANGRFSESTHENLNLKIEPTLSKDERWVTVNYVLSEPNGQLTACINVKNGDSLLLGTLESPKPGFVRLVFLHTSSAS